VNRDKESFEWFSQLLGQLERSAAPGFLEINVFLTERMAKEADIRALMAQETSAHDVVTGLSTETMSDLSFFFVFFFL
jgi:hypothetical protein